MILAMWLQIQKQIQIQIQMHIQIQICVFYKGVQFWILTMHHFRLNQRRVLCHNLFIAQTGFLHCAIIQFRLCLPASAFPSHSWIDTFSLRQTSMTLTSKHVKVRDMMWGFIKIYLFSKSGLKLKKGQVWKEKLFSDDTQILLFEGVL